jgi:hypothetical protein
MFDNLRDSAESSFYEEEPNDLYKETVATPVPAPRRRIARNRRLLGMTAQQRFLVSIMFFLTICIMGTLAMFVFEKMSLF